MDPLILICILLSFIVTLIICPIWIKQAKKYCLVGVDMHKHEKTKVAEIGGIPILFGFIVGILCYVAIDVFYFTQKYNTPINLRVLSIMAAIVAVLIAAIIGLIDDILGWKIGLRQWQKPVLMLVAALPISTVNAGSSIMTLPLIGKINLGILYPLIVIPFAISGAANAFNMIAGYNGLEAGMGIIIISSLSYISWELGKSTWVAVFGLCIISALIAFYIFNRYPAKIFPGDTMTYSVGVIIAIMAIMGDLEKAALLLFIHYLSSPYFLYDSVRCM